MDPGPPPRKVNAPQRSDRGLSDLVAFVLTFAVIIGSEIIPKTVGERYSEPIAMAVAAPVLLLTRLLFPLIWLIERIVAPINRGDPPRLTTDEAEIALLARIGHKEGAIQSDEAAFIERVFSLNDTTARMIMTPRVSLTWLAGDRTLRQVRDDVVQSQHTRILVVGESVDQVIGVVRRGRLLAAMIRADHDRPIRELARPVRLVPDTTTADILLRSFQQTRQHLAVVIDEFGGVAGVVTLEDVLEVLTGEIVDETDLAEDLQAEARARLARKHPSLRDTE